MRKIMACWVVVLPVLVLAEGPTTKPVDYCTYKNKPRTQEWFHQQYDKQKYNFEKQKNGQWRDVGFKMCKMRDKGITESLKVGTIARIGEDFKFIYLIKSIKGEAVVVHTAFNPIDRVYVQPTPQNRFASTSKRQMNELTVGGQYALNTSWTFDFIITGYADGRTVRVGDRVEGVFVCEKNDYKNGNLPVWSEIRPISQAEFKEIIESNIPLFDYTVKTTQHTRKKKTDRRFKLPVN